MTSGTATSEPPAHHLEVYLSEAPVERVTTAVVGGGGTADKTFILLSGGVQCFAKYESPSDRTQARRETSAWRILRLLGWDDLGVVTVYRRDVPTIDGGMEPAAVMPFVQETEDAPGLDRLDEHDIIRAGVFDYLIENSDRDGRNWIGIEVGQPKYRLILIDHGYTFGYMGRRLLSEFWSARRHERLPEKVLDSIRQLADTAEDDAELNMWLERDHVAALVRRARNCLETGRLPAAKD